MLLDTLTILFFVSLVFVIVTSYEGFNMNAKKLSRKIGFSIIIAFIFLFGIYTYRVNVNSSYNRGFKDGREEAVEETDAYTKGYEAGQLDGHAEGFGEGYDMGFKVGAAKKDE